jgi:RNA polymerase sigma-70 factor (ECF subfamily)
MPDAPDALFEAYSRGLFRYFYRAVGHADTARDLTQEVFLRVTRAPRPETPGQNTAGWLFRIARNLALDHHRARRRRPDAVPLVDTRTRQPSQEVDAAVHAALSTLSDLDRDVFLMREMGGLGYGEIAAACELTEDAVRSRIHRARAELRRQLAAPIATCRTIGARRLTQTT